MAAGESISQQDAQDALQQLQYLQNVYTQRYEILNEQITTYNIARDAVIRSVDLIERAGSLEGSSVLVNADGGTYIEASIKKVEKVITYVGAGYLLEKPLADAKEFLQGTVKNGEGAITKLLAERQRMEKELFDISYKIAAFRQV